MSCRDGEEPEQRELLPSSASTTTSEHELDDAGESSNQSVTTLRSCCIIASLGVLIFLQAANFSIITTTQSTIAAELDAFAEVIWFTSAYLIAMSSLAPLAGRLSQIFSPRNCIFVSTLIFAFGTLWTSHAYNLPLFLAGRAITGVGAAGIMTLAVNLVIALTSKKTRGIFVGLINTGYTIGVSLGAVLAGALLGPMGWRALFWIQTPLAFAAGVCIFFSVPSTFTGGPVSMEKQTVLQKLARIDYLGAVLLTSSITTLLVTLSSPVISPLIILVSFLLLTLFLLTEIYLTNTPIIPVTLLRSRGALLTCFSQLGLMMCRWTVLFYTPVYALALRDWSPAAAGSILIPTNAGFALGGLLVGWFHIRRDGSFYFALLVIFAMYPLSFLLLGVISTPETPVALYVAATFVNGLITGAALNYTLAHLLHLTAPSTHFVATSLLGTFRGFAGSFGSAVGGGIFTRVLGRTLEQGFDNKGLKGRENLVRRLLGSPALVAGLTGVEKEVALIGYEKALKSLFWAAAGMTVVTVVIQAGTGWKAGKEQDYEALEDDSDGGHER